MLERKSVAPVTEYSRYAELHDRIAELEDLLAEEKTAKEDIQAELDGERDYCSENHVAFEQVPPIEDCTREMRDFIHRFKYRSAPSHPAVSELIEAIAQWERELNAKS